MGFLSAAIMYAEPVMQPSTPTVTWTDIGPSLLNACDSAMLCVLGQGLQVRK